MIQELTGKFGSEVAEKAVSAFKSGEGIFDIVKNGIKDVSGKEIADALTSSATKEFGENLSAKGMNKLQKSLGKFTQMADTIH